MRAEFEASCLPTHRCATIGYKSITFTLPKEVSLFAEGHREKAREAMNAAVGAALDRAFPGMAYAAVAAIHTRNEAGEIHYHAHVLVGKFAVERATGRVLSLNGKRGGNGPSSVRDLKVGWKEGVEKEFKERLGLTIEQRAPNAAPALVMPDGTRLEPLNRASRRQLEKDVAPWYAVPDKSGAVVQRQLRLNAMDDRIFEVAAGGRPATGWNSAAFRELFPEQVRFIARYEKRVETLKSIGYLTTGWGQLTAEFRLHFAIKNGIDTPELQRLRLDLANQNAREAGRRTTSRRPVDLSESSDKSEAVRRRVERLGLSRDDIRRIQREAEARKPTPERLRAIRMEALRRAFVQPCDQPATDQDRSPGLHGSSSSTNSARLPLGLRSPVVPVRRGEKDRRQAPANRRARSLLRQGEAAGPARGGPPPNFLGGQGSDAPRGSTAGKGRRALFPVGLLAGGASDHA